MKPELKHRHNVWLSLAFIAWAAADASYHGFAFSPIFAAVGAVCILILGPSAAGRLSLSSYRLRLVAAALFWTVALFVLSWARFGFVGALHWREILFTLLWGGVAALAESGSFQLRRKRNGRSNAAASGSS